MLTKSIGLLFVSITGIILLYPNNKPFTAQASQSQSKQEQTMTGGVRFEPKAALDGLTEDGLRFSSETWESSDGVAVFLRRQHCKSPKNAERALRQQAKNATKIFETKLRKGKKGRKLGLRMVVSFGNDIIQRPQMILWTDGDMLYTVESSSFNHALLFEKMLPDL